MSLKRCYLFFVCTFLFIWSQAQDRTKPFNLYPPEERIEVCFYNQITVIDQREDTTNLGYTQTGAFNKIAIIISEPSLASQVLNYCDSLKDLAYQDNRHLVILLRKWQYSEETGASAERGYCSLRISSYAKEGDLYYPLIEMNKTVVVQSMEVSRQIQTKSKEEFQVFISRVLQTAKQTSIAYSLEELKNIDKIKRQELPLYASGIYKTGAYRNYDSFKIQIPDDSVSVLRYKDGTIRKVRYLNSSGDWKKMTEQSHYGFVNNDKLYVCTKFGYYRLKRKDEDFQFVGLLQKTLGPGELMASALLFGMIGAALVQNDNEWYVVRIDPLDGSFIRLRVATDDD